ncbi:MAG: proton-conducting transporter membrane subunit [Elusimicrobiota bacterium]|jgi:multicomponent Na+:H+ antiporter subunit D
MTATRLIPFFVVLPLAGVFLIMLFGWKLRRFSEGTTLLVTLSLLALSFFSIGVQHAQSTLVHFSGGWKPPAGILLVEDGLTVFMLVTVHLVACCIVLFAISYMKKYTSPGKFYALFLMTLSGMNGILVTGDLFNLFVFLEVSSLSACALVAFGTERHELEAAFKYGVMNTLGAAFVLLGIAFLYAYCSTLNMADMAKVIAEKGGGRVVPMAAVLFIMGFGLKAALVPFHAWLPDAHPSAPAPISAMLSGLIIKCLGVYTLFRVLFCVLGMTPMLRSVLLFLGALSMGVGAFSAVGQWDIKRLLAYSSLSQIGYIVFGIGLGTPLGILGGLLHLFNHSVGKSLLFLTSGAVDYATGTRDMRKMGGLSQRMPVTSATGMIGAMSIAGVPPFGGFWSKLLIIFAAVQAGYFGYAAWAVLAGVVTMGYLAKAMKQTFAGALPESLRQVQEVPLLMRCAMVILAILCVGGGLLLLPGIQEAFLRHASEVLLNGSLYAKLIG